MNIREWTLPVYTILMQLSCGALLALWLVRSLNKPKYRPEEMDHIFRYPLLIIFFTILTAMIGSHFHLSQPLQSVLSVINFHTSWLSREIVFNILYFFSTASLLDLIWYVTGRDRIKTILGWVTILFGLLTVYCSGRIYLISTQPVWNTTATVISFYSTTLLLGTTALPLMMMLDIKFAEVRSTEELRIRQEILRQSFGWFTAVAILSAGVILASTLHNINRLGSGSEAAQTSLRLLFGLYEPLLAVRILTIISGLSILLYTASLLVRKNRRVNDLVVPLYIASLLVIVSEILGRILFYATHVRLGI